MALQHGEGCPCLLLLRDMILTLTIYRIRVSSSLEGQEMATRLQGGRAFHIVSKDACLRSSGSCFPLG